MIRPLLLLGLSLGLLASPLIAQDAVLVYKESSLVEIEVLDQEIFARDQDGKVFYLERKRFALRPHARAWKHPIRSLEAGRKLYAVDQLGNGLILSGESWKVLFDAKTFRQKAKRLVSLPRGWAVLTERGNLFLGGKDGYQELCKSADCGIRDIRPAEESLWILDPEGNLATLNLSTQALEPYVQSPNLPFSHPKNQPMPGAVPEGVELVGTHSDQNYAREVFTRTRTGDIVRGLDVGYPAAGGPPVEMDRRISRGQKVQWISLDQGVLYALHGDGRLFQLPREKQYQAAAKTPEETLAHWEEVAAVPHARGIASCQDFFLMIDSKGQLWQKNRAYGTPEEQAARQKAKFQEFYGGGI